MSTFYNAQINNQEKKYSIQFETGNYEWFKAVERYCQQYVNKADEQAKKLEEDWKREFG